MKPAQGRLIHELFTLAQWDLTAAVIRVRVRRHELDEALIEYFAEQATNWSGLSRAQLQRAAMLGAIGVPTASYPPRPGADAWVVLYQAAHRVGEDPENDLIAPAFKDKAVEVLRGQIGGIDAMRLLASSDPSVVATMELALGVISYDPNMLALVGQATRATAALVVPTAELLDYVASSHHDPMQGLREAWTAAIGEARSSAPLDPERAKQLLVRALDYSSRTPEPHDDLDTIIALLQLDRRVVVQRDVEWCLDHLKHLARTGNVAPHAVTAFFTLDECVREFGLKATHGNAVANLGHDLLRTRLPPEEWKALAARVVRRDIERSYFEAAPLVLAGFRSREPPGEPRAAYAILDAELNLAQGDHMVLERLVDYAYRRLDPGEEADMLAAAAVLEPDEGKAAERAEKLAKILARVPEARRVRHAVQILSRHSHAHARDRVRRLVEPLRVATSTLPSEDLEVALEQFLDKPSAEPTQAAAPAGPVPTRHECLLAIQGRQEQRPVLLLQAHALRSAGQLRRARGALTELLELERDLLRLTRLHDEHYTPPMGVEGLAASTHDTLQQLASVHEMVGQGSEAAELRAEADELARSELGEVWLEERERERIPLLTSRGRFAAALDVLARCRDRALASCDAFGFVRTSVDEAELRLWLGDSRVAHERLEKAARAVDTELRDELPKSFQDAQERDLRSARQTELGRTVAARNMALYQVALELRYFRARAAEQSGDFNRAEDLFAEVRADYEALGIGTVIDYELANVDLRRGNTALAQKKFEALASAFEEDERLVPKRPAFLRTRARAAFALDKPDEALTLLDEALTCLAEHPDAQLSWRIHALRGEVLRSLGREHEALGASLRAIEAIDRLRCAPLGFRLDAAFLKDKRPVYEDAIRSAVGTNDPPQVCRLIESIKSRSLGLVLSVPTEIAAGTESGASDLDTLRTRFAELSLRIDGLAFDHHARRASPGADAERMELVQERDALFDRIRTGDPRWHAIREPDPFDLDAVLRYLATRDYRALQLFRDGGDVHVVLLAPDGCTLGTKKLSEKAIFALTEYQANLAGAGRPVADYDRTLFDPSASLGLSAAHLVPKDLLEQALGGQGLIVSPIGDLHLLPWGALTFRKRRLFEYNPVSILPNLSVLPILAVGEQRSTRVAILGAPTYDDPTLDLPATAGEVSDLRAIYGLENVLGVAQGEDATEARLGELLDDPQAQGAALHLACHGTFAPEAPLTSGLMLRDGQVDVGEIAMRRIPYADVVLSACSTGWRATRLDDVELLGDDILGIPGAFLEAGASSVLVSVSPIGDRSARELVVEYHRARREGQTPMKALQEAQLGLLLRPELAPCQWVGFNLYGSE